MTSKSSTVIVLVSLVLLSGFCFYAASKPNVAVRSLWGGQAQRAVPAEEGSPLAVEPACVRFGNSGQFEVLSGQVVLTNTSRSRLVITNVAKSCDCSQPEIEKNELEPGESCRMKINWKTNNSSGNKKINLILYYQLNGVASNHTHSVVTLETTVLPNILPSPDAFVFSEGVNSATVTLRPGVKELPELTGVYTSNPLFRATIAGTNVTCERLDASSEPLGEHYVLVQTSEASVYWLRIPIIVKKSPNTSTRRDER